LIINERTKVDKTFARTRRDHNYWSRAS